jgi:hypothetical protein
MSEAPRPSETALPLSVARRVDAVCYRFEMAWKAGQRPPARPKDVTIPDTPRGIKYTLNEGDGFMIVRSRTVMLALAALLGASVAAPGAWAVDITRGSRRN